MKLLAFDIETASPAPDRRSGDGWKLGITCAATWNGEKSQVFAPYNTQKRYADRMTPDECRVFAYHLMAHHEEGYTICSINGAGFDFPVLAAECESLLWHENLTDLALDHFDPGFQMLAVRGFMVGLSAMARGFDLAGKTKGMDGLKAIEMWQGGAEEQSRVLEYVAQDARATHDICSAIGGLGRLKWVTQKGYRSFQPIPRLLTVRECLDLPTPDQAWMTKPFTREEVLSWTATAETT